MESYWQKTTTLTENNSFLGESDCDVVIIGAGMAGILTAYKLKTLGKNVIILDASHTASGQTRNTTAKITSQHGLIYHKLIGNLGIEKARQYAVANEKAITEYATIIKEHTISCDFNFTTAGLYAYEDTQSLELEKAAAEMLGISCEYSKDNELPFKTSGTLTFENQAEFHPLKFLEGISKDLTIYNNSRVTKVENNTVYTDNGKINAKHIVFTCHYPFVNFPGFYFLRMYQERSYVLALENTQKMNSMYIGIDGDKLSFRKYGDLMLLGGSGHHSGYNKEGGQYDYLSKTAKEFWKDSKEITHWSAQDCMTLDNIPYIGRFSPSKPNWYVATGFNKWGMTSSMVSSMIISDLICGKENEFAEVFNPHRLNLSMSVGNILKNVYVSAVNLSKSFLTYPLKSENDVSEGNADIVHYHGKKTALYKENKDNIHAVSPRCSHLGCQLVWNPEEKTWDCPCHGSRFTKDGECINEPAQSDLKKHCNHSES